MWLMYYKWNLRTTCNDFETIVFTVKHKEQAMSLLINEAFQQQVERGKWTRVKCFQSSIVFLFLYTEIYDFKRNT
jgi:hypothetical protein